MSKMTQRTMRAIAIDRFGGTETLKLRTLPIPEIGPGEVLLRVHTAGIGEWDPFEREGGYAEMQGTQPAFPYVLGSEGSGTIVAVGAEVEHVKEGDTVYAASFLNPKGGFYAEYAAVPAEFVAHIPGQLTTEQAGVMSGVGVTALRGLDDTLALKPGESLVVFGASGGIGHVAVQLAKRIGARVLAIASGDDGVALARQLGADMCLNGRTDDLRAAAQAFAPNGFDAALLTAGGDAVEQIVSTLHKRGRVAYPNGIQPEPTVPDGIQVKSYNGEPDAEIIGRLNRLIMAGPFDVHIAQTFPLERAAAAHHALEEHYLGKLALRIE